MTSNIKISVGGGMNSLIIGGSSALGLALAQKLQSKDDIHVTGRHDPNVSGITYHELDLSDADSVSSSITGLIASLPHIDQLIYSAGYYQEGTVTDLNEQQIQEMLSVGIVAAIYVVRELLLKQGELSEFVAVTSTSQYTPRLLEPIYTVVKAGLGAFANSLSLDPRVKKTLVAGPAGIKTKFHDGREVNMSTYLTSEWVAEQIMAELSGDFSYKYVRILREPARVELQEKRQTI